MPLSPYLACSLLSMFIKNRAPLSEERFDECFDALVALMEEANDHKFDLTPKGEESP